MKIELDRMGYLRMFDGTVEELRQIRNWLVSLHGGEKTDR